jgi:hypothetical protein
MTAALEADCITDERFCLLTCLAAVAIIKPPLSGIGEKRGEP